ncbi:MAG: STAS/SEC14 domain-containing protein [Nannocystaceae bacterium]|nr:STAS/SEC14 domain-containing protein [Nannocystaceae bacterium]
MDAVRREPSEPVSIPPRPLVHYTQQPSRLEACNDNDKAVLRLQGGGVLTVTIIEQAFSRMRESQSVPPNLLIDLRDVAGYESHAVACANSLLEHAPAYGVRRIAFLASSGAVHAAAQVASSRAIVPLRSFANERSARDWLVS